MDQAQPTGGAAADVAASAGGSVTAFVCVNCGRGSRPAGQDLRARPEPVRIDWPCPTKEVWVPCAGRLQPEHLLKALEDGADLVCVVACEEDNCHYLQGSRRATIRMEYVERLLAEIGLEADRVLACHLPGSAKEDLAAGEPGAGAVGAPADLAERLARLRDDVAARLAALGANPLREAPSQA